MGKPKQKWTLMEVQALQAGVTKHGEGMWKDILNDPEFSSALSRRTNVNLKDKWRNLRHSAAAGAPATSPPVVARTSPVADGGDTELVFELQQPRQPHQMYTELVSEALSSVKDFNGSEIDALGCFLECLLHFMYRNSLAEDLETVTSGSLDHSDITESLVVKVLAAADLYGLNRLKSICESHISNKISVKSVAKLLVLADECQAEELKAACLNFTSENLEDVVRSEAFECLKESSPMQQFELLEIVAGSGEACSSAGGKSQSVLVQLSDGGDTSGRRVREHTRRHSDSGDTSSRWVRQRAWLDGSQEAEKAAEDSKSSLLIDLEFEYQEEQREIEDMLDGLFEEADSINKGFKGVLKDIDFTINELEMIVDQLL